MLPTTNDSVMVDGMPKPDAPTARTDGFVLPVPAKKLTFWNGAMCLFHSTLAAVTLAVGDLKLRVPVYSSAVELLVLPNNTDAFALVPATPATRTSWLYFTGCVAAFFLLSAAFHLGNALVWRTWYLRALEKGYAPFRWLEYSASASVMVLILAYVSGTLVQSVLVSLFALTFITMVFGHLHEVICRPESLDEWAVRSKLWRLQAHFFGYVPQCFAWGLIIAQFIEAGAASTTDSSGEERKMPSFVYAIVFGEVVIFWSFGLVQLVVSLRPPCKYYQGEIAYMYLSLFAKGFLGIIVLANLLVLDGNSEIYEQS